jgi:4-hydroxybenzoate polyprenyltransferase
VSSRLRERWSLWLDLIRWNRPAGWLLLLWPSLSALWIAAHGWPGWHLLAVFRAGHHPHAQRRLLRERRGRPRL